MEEEKNSEFKLRDLNLQSNPISRTTLNNIFITGLILIATLISFTNSSVTIGNIRNLTAITVFLYIVTTAVYQNQYAKGKERGKKEKEFIASQEKLNEVRKQLDEYISIDNLADYCRNYVESELKSYRTIQLMQVNMKYSDYEPYLGKSFLHIYKDRNLLSAQKRVIIKCNRAKPIKMTVSKLMSDYEGGSRGKLIFESGAKREIRDKTFNLIRRAFTTLFSGLIVVDIIMDWSWQTLIQWGIRMMPVLTALVVGESAGYSNITVTEVRYKEGQVNCLLDFKKYMDRKKDEKITLNQEKFPDCSQNATLIEEKSQYLSQNVQEEPDKTAIAQYHV